jgi:hypothetical protein
VTETMPGSRVLVEIVMGVLCHFLEAMT